ncbi:hypothetical protein LXA43DRAFT_1095924 [Ganoderma leucocontextum]|nr:hypothetical protein LXA43DRAFT_1095924 [Ganoderma leucocontextum]
MNSPYSYNPGAMAMPYHPQNVYQSAGAPPQGRYPELARAEGPSEYSSRPPGQPLGHAPAQYSSCPAGQYPLQLFTPYPVHGSSPHSGPPYFSSQVPSQSSTQFTSEPQRASHQYPRQGPAMHWSSNAAPPPPLRQPPANHPFPYPGEFIVPTDAYNPFMDPAFMPHGSAQHEQPPVNTMGHVDPDPMAANCVPQGPSLKAPSYHSAYANPCLSVPPRPTVIPQGAPPHPNPAYHTNHLHQSNANGPHNGPRPAPPGFSAYPDGSGAPVTLPSVRPPAGQTRESLAHLTSTFAPTYTNSCDMPPNVSNIPISQPPPNVSNVPIPQPPPNVSNVPIPQPPPTVYNATGPQPPPNVSNVPIPQPPPTVYNATGPQPPSNVADDPTIPQPQPVMYNATVPQPPTGSVPQAEPSTSMPSNGQGAATFMPPLDMGPSATRDDLLRLWKVLTPEDHQLLMKLCEDRIQSPQRLFTVGSSEPKARTSGTKKRSQGKRKPRRERPPATAPSPDAPPPAPAPSADSGNLPRRPFKSPWVEDYRSESDDDDDDNDEDDDDAVPIPWHMKGKGRAADVQEPESPNPPGQKIPPLNVRPNAPNANRNHDSPFSAVLDAVHWMSQRMDHLEVSVKEGLKQMDDTVSGMAVNAQVAQAGANPFGHKTKGPKAAVARLIAVRDGKGTASGVRSVPNRNAHPSSNAMPPTQPTSTDAHRDIRGVYAGQQGTQYPPQAAQCGHAFGSGPTGQSAPYPTSTQVHPGFGGGSAGQRGAEHSTPAWPGPEMGVAEIEKMTKLYRKYVRAHLWNELLRIKGPEQLPERCPPLTDDEFEQYMHIKDRVLNADNFRIDFTRG